MNPRKVLTPEQMQQVDRATIDAGIPGLILMENAAHRVVEFMREKFAPITAQRIVVVCGKGNNGGDGLAVARLLFVVCRPEELRVVLTVPPEDLQGEAAANLQMMRAAGLEEYRAFGPEMRAATVVIDAVLGTGLKGAAKGPALDAIREINTSFRHAKVVAIDIPSGLAGDSGDAPGEFVRADATVTFTAPKVCHALPPACGHMGHLHIAPIGSAESLYEKDDAIQLALVTPSSIAPIFAKRISNSNKGMYGHVLVVAGARGKSGAAVMAGIAALRAGAGLVTVACPASALDAIAAHSPEIMTVPLPETESGGIATTAYETIIELASSRTIVALGPGIGTHDETRTVVTRLFDELEKPMVIDADALNCLTGSNWKGGEFSRVLTPHPGEMSRLAGVSTTDIQAGRLSAARKMAQLRNVTVVLKGDGTLIAFPDGQVWINPTGSPAMATGGTGDILTGMVAGLMGQFPNDAPRAIAAAVYLHGLAGQIAATHLTEQAVIATDLLRYFPEATRAITDLSHGN